MKIQLNLIVSFLFAGVISLAIVDSMIQASNDGSPLIPNRRPARLHLEEEIRVPAPSSSLSERREYALRLWQSGKYKAASTELRNLWNQIELNSHPGYNPEFVMIARDLANVYEDMGASESARDCYQSILNHEELNLKSDDPKIAVEYNNIGLCRYLQGLGEVDDQIRATDFKMALASFQKAEKLWHGNRLEARDLSLNLRNQFVTLCELGDEREAGALRRRMQTLIADNNVLAGSDASSSASCKARPAGISTTAKPTKVGYTRSSIPFGEESK